MVKGAAKTAAAPAAASGSAGATGQRLPQMGTGLNVAGNPVDNVENIHHVSSASLVNREGTRADD